MEDEDDQNLAPGMDAAGNQFAFEQPMMPQGGFNWRHGSVTPKADADDILTLDGSRRTGDRIAMTRSRSRRQPARPPLADLTTHILIAVAD